MHAFHSILHFHASSGDRFMFFARQKPNRSRQIERFLCAALQYGKLATQLTATNESYHSRVFIIQRLD